MNTIRQNLQQEAEVGGVTWEENSEVVVLMVE
jgi:hypothetical protein